MTMGENGVRLVSEGSEGGVLSDDGGSRAAVGFGSGMSEASGVRRRGGSSREVWSHGELNLITSTPIRALHL